MRKLRITLAQINTIVGDLEGNVDKCIEALKKAEAAGSDLIVFPELTITGYPPEDLLLKPAFIKKCGQALDRFTENVGYITAVIGYVEGRVNICNSAAVVSMKKVQFVYNKMFLPNYGVFDEKRYFTPGQKPMSFMIGDTHIGLSICEDTWVKEGPHRILCDEHNVDVIINISASPFHSGKVYTRANILSQRSRSSKAAIAYVNLVGGQDELVFDGGSMVFDKSGVCIAKAPSFREHLLHADIEFEGESSEGLGAVTRLPVKENHPDKLESVIAPALSEEEEVLEALILGTRDYIQKNGFQRVLIGMSGGIDSSIVAAIAAEALGPENVVGVTMPSKYTSTGTRTDAEIVSKNLGIGFMEIPIGNMFTDYLEELSGLFKGLEPGVAEENIQARIRGTLLMALSNKFGWIVLTTGNKSELATGYATLYGDMAGGFAVIKDVPKTMVYRLSHLINQRAGKAIFPESLINRPPTAELRPDQKDSDSLPEYELLDPILKAYIEDDKSADEIVALGFDREIVNHIIYLCDKAEYKRRQTPPGVKITPKSFGRDRRLPITNRYRG